MHVRALVCMREYSVCSVFVYEDGYMRVVHRSYS